MATAAQDPKRLGEEPAAEDASPLKRARQQEQQEARGQQTSVLSVPTVADQIPGNTLLPALQQLLAVYKVEYWTLLEEMRSKRQTYCEAGRHETADEPEASNAAVQPDCTAEQPVLAAAQGSMRQLVQALGARQTAAGAADVIVVAEHDQHQQQDTADRQQDGQQQRQGTLYGDQRCGYGGPEEQPLPPSPAEAESVLLQLPPGADSGCATAEQLQAWHQRFKGAAAAIAGLEQLASAATTQYMDAQGGLACLCGAGGRWVIRRTAVSIGRSTDSKGDVDVDLSKAAAPPATAAAAAVAEAPASAGVPMTPAGAAAPPALAATPASAAATTPGATGAAAGLRSVSRLQAQLALGLDGSWSIRNTGRAAMAVNGRRVARGSSVQLPHLSLLEIAGEALLFMVNGMAVKRAVVRSSQLVM